MPLGRPRALLRDIAEVGVAQPEIRVPMTNHVERIESIETEPDGLRFGNAEILEGRNVNVPETWTAHGAIA